VSAFRGGIEIERYLWHARRILAGLGRRCVDVLTGAGVRAHPAVGAYYLFLDFAPFRGRLAERGIHTGTALCERLLEDAGVAVLPGSAFAQARTALTARLAYVNFDGAGALAASERWTLEQDLPHDFLDHWCKRTLEGVQAIAAWVENL
jgi:aspartate aminotransferase